MILALKYCNTSSHTGLTPWGASSYWNASLHQNLTMKLGMNVTAWSNIHQCFVVWAQKYAELESIFESAEIMDKSIVLQIPHLLYCDSSHCQNLAMRLGKHVNDIMIKHPQSIQMLWCQHENRWVGNYFWKCRNNGQRNCTADSSPVLLWFISSSELGHETWNACQQQHGPKYHPSFVMWAWKQVS